jgi:hypothetical protein
VVAFAASAHCALPAARSCRPYVSCTAAAVNGLRVQAKMPRCMRQLRMACGLPVPHSCNSCTAAAAHAATNPISTSRVWATRPRACPMPAEPPQGADVVAHAPAIGPHALRGKNCGQPLVAVARAWGLPRYRPSCIAWTTTSSSSQGIGPPRYRPSCIAWHTTLKAVARAWGRQL